MWGRAPLITDAGSWHVHLGTQQMEASLTPRRERNLSMDFAHTGSLMNPEVHVQQLPSPASSRPGKDRAPRSSDRSGNRLVCPARICGKRQQEGSLLICRIRSEFTTRFTVLPFRFPILLLAFFVLNNPDDLDADADVSLHQEFDAAFL